MALVIAYFYKLQSPSLFMPVNTGAKERLAKIAKKKNKILKGLKPFVSKSGRGNQINYDVPKEAKDKVHILETREREVFTKSHTDRNNPFVVEMLQKLFGFDEKHATGQHHYKQRTV